MFYLLNFKYAGIDKTNVKNNPTKNSKNLPLSKKLIATKQNKIPIKNIIAAIASVNVIFLDLLFDVFDKIQSAISQLIFN
ncbi:hypothetical protein AQSSE17_17990 [Streptococcus equi subsp. equi]|nr:hypothetical protein AQSSE10_18250 [Streptococcus equi subsp. equi]GMX73157.1 hypothetical protein AQSSE02_18460 [Streptococcus equi subsp. equi]GMX76825.1 hypothetical protein AQSSE03_17180 [Streptococcus equi subsp. equi]GMX81055.1 hypothetical protein AQSSE04_18390 [Streptococcus equi subsp. equi]GMX84898.1 hypothetical protein AQSSE05_18060 [Streptococcus equi subsp. equi]